MRLSETVKKELQDRWLGQLCPSSDIIVEDVFFAHLLPFIPRPELNVESIVEILKADENFYHQESMTESEVAFFANILLSCINTNIDGWLDHIDLYFEHKFMPRFRGHLLVRFNAQNLADILAGKFMLGMLLERSNQAEFFLSLPLLFVIPCVALCFVFLPALLKLSNSIPPAAVLAISTFVLLSGLRAVVHMADICSALGNIFCQYSSFEDNFEYNRFRFKFFDKSTYSSGLRKMIVTSTKADYSTTPLFSPQPL